MRSRPFALADLDAVVALIGRGELGEDVELDGKSRSTVASALGPPLVDPDRDVRLWCGDDGALRGFAWIRVEAVGAEVHGRLHYVIGASHDLSLEPEIVGWAGDRLAEDATGARRLVHPVAIRDLPRAARLARLGFVIYRSRVCMERTTAAPIPDLPLPPGYRMRASRGVADIDAYAAAFNQAFADSHDFSPLTVAELVHDMTQATYRPDRDLIVEDGGGAMVGFCYVTDDAAAPSQAYIGTVAVVRSHRGLGLGGALIAAALHALRADGVTDVQLHVDTDSPTGALRLYQRLGFTIRNAEVRYARSP